MKCVDLIEDRTETGGIWYVVTMDNGRKYDVQYYPGHSTIRVEREGRNLSRMNAPNVHVAICQAFKARGLMQ
jgi:hypothetical protein